MATGFLRETLVKESRAYGFTIAFWGSGALLIKAHGFPSLGEALLYGGGAVAGFALLTLLVYGKVFGSAEYESSNLPILGLVHYLSALIPIATSFYLAMLDPEYAFFLAGAAVSILYNLGMLVEEIIDRKITDRL